MAAIWDHAGGGGRQIEDVLLKDGGVAFLGGSASLKNYEEGTEVLTFSGPITTPEAISVNLTRVGNLVNLSMELKTDMAGNSAALVLVSSTGVSAKFIPLFNTFFPIYTTTDGGTSYHLGRATVFAGSGLISLADDESGGAFNTAGQLGHSGVHITYRGT